ncbi:hypothetical protein [Kineococcus sp. R86509]|uniref:hypothetical protein n=1 Tax=Kineococcus sp. R86509 TaxID=3093851 RepID=UPI0036D2F42E
MPPGSPSHPALTPRRSPLLTLVAALVIVEALILVGAAVYLLHGLLVEDAAAPIAAIAMVVMALIFAVGVGFCGWGLLHRATWARSPVVVWQLLELAAGIPAFSGGSPWVGVVLVVPAVVVLVGLFVPSVSAQVSR